MSQGLTIRPARPDDRPAMERICAHTWDWGDYIPEVWDDWLAAGSHSGGGVFVGETGGWVVALSQITFQTPDQVWLAGMRVDPDYRRQGIAGRLLDHSLAHARKHGARVVRLGTGYHKTPVHKIAARAGMERVGVYALRLAEALPGARPATILGPDRVTQVQAFLDNSPVLAHTRGLYGARWTWQELSAGHVVQLLEAGQVSARCAAGGEVIALVTTHPEPEDDTVWLGFADGDPAAVAELARAIRAQASELGANEVATMLPDLAWLRDAFHTAGYGVGDWEGELWIFERWLVQEPHAGAFAGGNRDS
jgi:predicted N-acetyltransferase YhbS